MKVIEKYNIGSGECLGLGHLLIYDELVPGAEVKWRGNAPRGESSLPSVVRM